MMKAKTPREVILIDENDFLKGRVKELEDLQAILCETIKGYKDGYGRLKDGISEAQRLQFVDRIKELKRKLAKCEASLTNKWEEADELEADYGRLQNDNQKYIDKRIAAEAKLERVEALPEQWREISRRKTQEYTDLYGAADQLEAALQESE